MKSYLYIPLLVSISFIFVNCSDSSDKKSEVVNLDEFLPKSEKDYNYEDDTIVQTEEHIPDSIELLIQSRMKDAEFQKNEELSNTKHFPDRLDYAERFYHEVIIDSTLNDVIVWEFEDSIHTVNAFYNWLDCFGPKCNSLRIGEKKWVYDGAFQLFVDDLKLIFISSKDNISFEEWSNVFQPTEKKTWNFRLYQPLKRQTKWIGLKEEN